MLEDATKPIIPKPGPRRRRRLLLRLLGGAALLAIVAAIGWGFWGRGLGPAQPGADDVTVEITIPHGATAQDIAATLAAMGLISKRPGGSSPPRDGSPERFQARATR